VTTVFLSPLGNGFNFATTGWLPLAGGKVYTYQAGTTTPMPTYTTADGDTQNDNPIILGVDGRPPQGIWLVQGMAYKFLLADSLDNPIQTYDDLTGINDISGGAVAVAHWLCFAASNQALVITAGTDKFVLNAFPAFQVLEVRGALVTASSSGVVTFDININNVSILSTKITVDANEVSSLDAAVQPVISSATIANNAKLSIDYDTVGTGAKGPAVLLRGLWL